MAQPVLAAEPAGLNTWVRTARIGGAAVWVDMTDAEMNTLLNKLAAQHVSVIEADSDLSNYLTDAEFDQELALIKNFAQKAHAHAAQFKVVWYYPTLEALTANAASTPNTMAKNHPDWLQYGIDGTQNSFIGGSGQVFWVDPGMESAWLSPSSPYRDYFFHRLSRIANETGVDGVWGDVPLYCDFGPIRWADTNPYAVSQFQAAHPGSTVPTVEDWNNPDWRRWIAWRHHELRRFIADAAAMARAKNPDFLFIVETLPTDYAMSTVYGLEGVDLRSIEGVTHVWEVDTMSNATALRKAREDDWISYISMQKYIKAASGSKPAWSFAYGKQANDAELVMAEILAAGNNPYELKIPEMTTTVGAAYRTKMFGWIQAHENQLWQNSAARVGVLYSPASRDYVDRASGEGMYATTNAGSDSLFWNDDLAHSAYQRQYVAEYRGMIKLLVHNHIPFDAVLKPGSAAELAKYQTLILPDYEALSDEEAQIIRDYVSQGGHVIMTGPNPSGLDSYGASRSDYALAAVLGVTRGSALPTAKTQAYGYGEARFFADLLGKKYFTNASDAAAAAGSLLTAIQATTTPWLTTQANKKVHMELTKTDQRLILQMVNFIGVTGTFTITPTTFQTTVNIPDGQMVTAVEMTSPDHADPGLQPLAFTTNAQQVTFTTPVTEYAMVLIHLSGGTVPTNRPPTANADQYTTTNDKPLSLPSPGLLGNDSDLDGDAIRISDHTAPTNGTVIVEATGGLTFTPVIDFVGTSSFNYTVSDGQGGTSTATVVIAVSAPATNRPPVATNDIYSTTKDIPLVVASPGILTNDHDPDGDSLTVSGNTAPGHGTVNLVANGAFTYTPSIGFTGNDSFNYTLSDGKGGSASSTATISVVAAAFTPQILSPTAVTISTGKLDYGTMASLKASDSDTYDVNSAFSATEVGGVTDWYAIGHITGNPSAVSRLTLTYGGQYSKANVSQQLFLYNFATKSWDRFDTRTVGNSQDVTVTTTPTSPANYISSTGEVRTRVRGFRAGAKSTSNWKFFCWGNQLKWEVN
jgi:hypothetical protein